MSELVADINAILTRYSIQEVLMPQDIVVTDNVVLDTLRQDAKLSKAIIDHVWPSIRSARVFHYTSREAAEAILSTGIFQLTNLEKRLNDGEVAVFCETHGLDGYLANDAEGVPIYRTLVRELYYASFTESNISQDLEEYFWRNFAVSDGVRLTMDIKAERADFRRIAYEPNPGMPIPLLHELVSTIRQRHGREFVLQGISSLCAFYLSGQHYSREREYRALVKAWPDMDPRPVGSGKNSYIEVPLGQVAPGLGYEFRIAEVQAFVRPEMPKHYVFSERMTSGP